MTFNHCGTGKRQPSHLLAFQPSFRTRNHVLLSLSHQLSGWPTQVSFLTAPMCTPNNPPTPRSHTHTKCSQRNFPLCAVTSAVGIRGLFAERCSLFGSKRPPSWRRSVWGLVASLRFHRGRELPKKCGQCPLSHIWTTTVAVSQEQLMTVRCRWRLHNIRES